MDGVLAGMDSGRKTLQVAGFARTSARRVGNSAPEPRFNIFYVEIRDSAGIAPGTYGATEVFLGIDLALSESDSAAYSGSAGSVTLSAVSESLVEGTFFATAVRGSDGDSATVSGGTFRVSPVGGLFLVGDTGMTGGSISVSADTGTTPVYTWTGGPVNALTVSRVSNLNAAVWGVLIAGEDSIASGVVHGVTPAGALRTGNAELVLTPGILYRVRVSRTGGGYGYANFIP